MFRLDNKVAIVTGAARGQGAATARLFAQRGARVIVADMTVDDGEAVAQEIGPNACFFELDVGDEGGWARLVEYATQWTGSPSILVNNAAIAFEGSLLTADRDAIDRVLTVNLIGPYLGMKHVVPCMIRRGAGAVVNVCSVNALRGTAFMSAYDASKWGLRGLSKSAAMEFAGQGVRINALHPGAIDTPMLNPNNIDLAPVAEAMGIQSGRVGRPNEVALMSLFLVSDEASYVNGTEIAVDGTWSAGVNLRDAMSAL